MAGRRRSLAEPLPLPAGPRGAAAAGSNVAGAGRPPPVAPRFKRGTLSSAAGSQWGAARPADGKEPEPITAPIRGGEPMAEKGRLARVNTAPPQQAVAAQGEEVGRVGSGRAGQGGGLRGARRGLGPVGAPRG